MSDSLPEGQELSPERKNVGATLKPATLGGVPGLGILQVVRSPSDKVLEVLGTWRLADDDNEHDVTPIHEAQEAGRSIVYQGPVTDPDAPEKERLEVEVTIKGISSYVFDQQELADNPRERELYNYELEGSLPYES
jgi:hypothetical protein